MLIKTLVVGPLETNCYVVIDEATKEAMVIDPGDEPDIVLSMAKGLKVNYIVLTHAHFDHVGAVPDIKESTGAKIALHKDERAVYDAAKDLAAFWGYKLDPLPEPDVLLVEGDELKIGNYTFSILHTPGHSPGCISLYSEGVVFTGDTLFEGSVGRTDLPGGDMKRLKESFIRLLSLPPKTRVLPGHGPETTIAREKAENFFAGEFLR